VSAQSIEPISSGSLIVEEMSNKRFEALLGTCVGVILIDPVNAIGGLYHILLPEPTSANITWDKENYASTGMPLFLHAMQARGAELNNLEAVVAGGALVGPISREDMQMDIGGRTTDVVIKFLNEHNISIQSSITGGYFSCRLSLDMSVLKYSIEPLHPDDDPSMSEDMGKIENIDIDAAIASVRPVPQIALKAIRLLNSGTHSMSEIAHELRQDQILSARIITLSNSAYLASRRRVDSVDRALVLLGEKMVLHMVLYSSLELFFQQSDSGYSLTRGGMFHHALTTAKVSEILARLTEAVEPDVAYTAGLMHDVGKVILDQYITKIFPTFYRRVYQEDAYLVEVEEHLLGISHTDAGVKMANLWSLPDNLTEVIGMHHDPDHATVAPKLVHIVYLADLLVSRFHSGNELERINTNGLQKRLAVLGLSMADFTSIVDYIPWKTIGNYTEVALNIERN
jgi:putative nucleotidyltransferase with HDIG domain